MNKITRGISFEDNQIRISKTNAEQYLIDSMLRYSVEISKDKIVLTISENKANTLKFYSFNNGYLKMVLKPEDIPDNLRSKFSKRIPLKIEIENNKIIFNF